MAKRDEKTFDVLQSIGLVTLGVVMLSLMVWIFLKNRDAFVVMITGIVAIGAFIMMGVTIQQKGQLETKQYQMLFSISLVLGLLNLIVMGVFIGRIVNAKKAKRDFLEEL